jgi:hypothetical protein
MEFDKECKAKPQDLKLLNTISECTGYTMNRI